MEPNIGEYLNRGESNLTSSPWDFVTQCGEYLTSSPLRICDGKESIFFSVLEQYVFQSLKFTRAHNATTS